MYRSFNAQLPVGGIDVDFDHDGEPRGTLIYGEVDRDERVHAVVVLDDGDRFLEVGRNVFFSSTLDMWGCIGDRSTSPTKPGCSRWR